MHPGTLLLFLGRRSEASGLNCLFLSLHNQYIIVDAGSCRPLLPARKQMYVHIVAWLCSTRKHCLWIHSITAEIARGR